MEPEPVKYNDTPEIVLGDVPEIDVPEMKVSYNTNSDKHFGGKITSSEDVADFLRTLIPSGELELQEQAIVLYLNTANKIIGYYLHSKGGINSTIMDIRIILSVALKAAAVSVILSHNHPSGNTKQSEEDIRITRKFTEACKLLDIKFLDHIIITKDSYTSFADSGLMGITYTSSSMEGKSKAVVTEAQAREAAKDLIRAYVHRGDSIQEINKSMLGSGNSEYSADVKSNKIIVDRVNETRVNFSFPLFSIFNELLNEKQNKRQTPLPPMKKVPKKAVKVPVRATTPVKDYKPVRIDYKEGHPVERIEEEIKFIKRFVMLHNREKTKAQILNFLNALQKAITEKRIRKNSQYAEQITQIQNQLVRAYNLMKDGQRFEIGKASLAKFTAIAGSEKIRYSTNYLKRFIGIQGRNIDKEKARKLFDLMMGAVKRKNITPADPYYDKIINVGRSLKYFIQVAKKGDTIALHRATLNGLDGVLGCACEDKRNKRKRKHHLDGIPLTSPKNEISDVMTVDQVRTMEYKPVNISGRWLELIGKFCLPTQFFVHGLGGSGKTSFVLLFTQYLASLGYRILYVAGEQYNTPTFTELLNRLNIVAGDNFKIVGSISTLNPADFDFVVLDSKDHLEINVDHFIALMKQYPSQSFIVLSQAVKSGNFTGRERWRNTVDVMIQADQGVVRTGHDKNRWGGAGELKIFEMPLHQRVAA